MPKPTPPSPSDTSEKCLDLLTLLWALLGDGSQEGKAPVFASGYTVTGSPANSTGTVGVGAGAGLDVSIRVAEIARTTFWIQALPFFISGDRGGMYAFPIGGAVRFQ